MKHTEKEIFHYRKITYQGHITNNLNKIFKKYNLKIATKTKNTIFTQLKNPKDKIHILQKSGVYKLTCDDCNAIYIGETGRSFEVRIREHLKNKNSNFGNHLQEKKHNFKIESNVEILHIENKSHKLTLLEAYEIDRHRINNEYICLNEQVKLFYTPLYLHINENNSRNNTSNGIT